MPTYRLRLSIKDSELILDYRERGTDNWVFAAGGDFQDPAHAHREFDALQALRPPAYGVMAAFENWRCIIPAPLQGANPVLVMSDYDFIEV